MPNFAQAIRTFQSGDLSRKEFFAQVDRVLASEREHPAQLLEILDEERTRIELPPDMVTELQQRIARAAEARHRFSAEETRVHAAARERSMPSLPPLPQFDQGAGGYPFEPERMKGVGDTLNGRFVLKEAIGFGGMGTVYKALDLRKLEASDRQPYVAIKVLNVQFRGHPKSLITLQREAKKAQALAHPNIVTVYDFDRDGSMVYLTMEYLSGRPLSQTLRAPGFKGMPWQEAAPIVGGIAKALAYAHERGFVHCDLKPANVFVTDGGDVKVIDFGIARAFQKPEEDMEATVFDPGSLGGLTPAYASPEMLEHREPDPRDDIYALACITYELLAGRHPFDRLSATDARNAGMRPQRPANLGHGQWRGLKCGLSFERNNRTPSVLRFLQEMSAAPRARLYTGIAGSALALAALVAGGYIWWSQPGPGPAGVSPPAGETPVTEAQQQEPVPEAPPASAAVPAEEPPAAEAPAAKAPAAEAPATEPPAAEAPATASPAAPSLAVPPLTLAAVTPVLAAVPCSATTAAVQGGAVQVDGYLGQNFGTGRLEQALRAIPGTESVKLDVQQVSEEKCNVIDTFAPYWQSNQQSGRHTSIHTRRADAVLTEGEPLVLNITTPGYTSYVTVDYYTLDGTVVHMVPSRRARANQAPPNYSATIGGLGNWVVAKPFGTEMIVLLVTPVPLFEELRPESEPGADYLRAVQARLKKIAPQDGKGVAADFVQITTRGRKS